MLFVFREKKGLVETGSRAANVPKGVVTVESKKEAAVALIRFQLNVLCTKIQPSWIQCDTEAIISLNWKSKINLAE